MFTRARLCQFAVLVVAAYALFRRFHLQSATLGCTGFLVTMGGLPDGEPRGWRACTDNISGVGGYCVCEGGAVVHHAAEERSWLTAWGRDARCSALCGAANPAKAPRIPDMTSCPAEARSQAPFFDGAAAFDPVVQAPQYARVEAFWRDTVAALTADDLVVVPPGNRDKDDDFVVKGLRMEAEHVRLAIQQWRAFLAHAGEYPGDAFRGRGIVILGGDVPYLVPALVTLKSLQKAGCRLPVQVWFPSDEAPEAPLAAKLAAWGVDVRILNVPSLLGKGFYMKAAVVLLSTFQEVLFLDADQVTVADVTSLFDSVAYAETGALLWPDFWEATWAPDAAKVLGVHVSNMPLNSHESGQMLFNKARVWPALVLALHFNLNNQLYYPLFTNFMGYGDKETFAMAMAAHQVPFNVVPHRVRALGIVRSDCDSPPCHHTNTMVQHSPDGKVMFLHTNMPPKWHMDVVTAPQLYVRRWQRLNGVTDARDFLEISNELFGFDVEMHIHGLLVSMRCDLDLWKAHENHVKANPPVIPTNVLPFALNGINLMTFYEDTGMSGTFLQDQPPTDEQRRRHAEALATVGRKFMRTDTIVARRRSFTLTRSSLYKQIQAHRTGEGTRLLMPSNGRPGARTTRARRRNEVVLGKIAQQSQVYMRASRAGGKRERRLR